MKNRVRKIFPNSIAVSVQITEGSDTRPDYSVFASDKKGDAVFRGIRLYELTSLWYNENDAWTAALFSIRGLFCGQK